MPLSEIAIELEKSNSYFRFILIIYLLTIILIIYSSIGLLFKLFLVGFVVSLLRFDWIHKNPCATIKKIQFVNNEWVLGLHHGGEQRFVQATVLINNVLFQLIQFTNPKQKRLIVLFQDQITNCESRFLHLKINRNSSRDSERSEGTSE